MPEKQNDPEIVTLSAQPVAVVREIVAMDALPEFFGRAYHAVAEAVGRQGIAMSGPPVGVYYGMPTDTVDVAAGFPTDRLAVAEGAVTTDTLPAGRAVQLLHQGSYDELRDSYGRLMAWVGEKGLTLGEVMWETYLTEPKPDGDMSEMLTLIAWPLAE